MGQRLEDIPEHLRAKVQAILSEPTPTAHAQRYIDHALLSPVKSAGQSPVTFELPWSPSVNHFLRHVELPLGGGKCPCCHRPMKSRVATLISADGRDWLRDADRVLAQLGLPLMHGNLACHLTLFPPNRRVIDLDNRQKPLLDLLKRRPRDEKQTRWLFSDDDSQVKDLHTVMGPVVAGGKVAIKVTPMGETAIQPELFADDDDCPEPEME